MARAKTHVPIVNLMAILDSECSILEQRLNALCGTELEIRFSDAADKATRLAHIEHVIEILDARLDEAYAIRGKIRRMITDIGGKIK